MRKEFKVYYKDGRLKGVEYFIEKYSGHFEVLKNLYNKIGYRIELI